MEDRINQTNCPNCGAPIQGEKCEYCGTIFYDLSLIDISSPCFIKLKFNGLVFLSEMYVADLSFSPHETGIVRRNIRGEMIRETSNHMELDMKLISINGYEVVNNGNLDREKRNNLCF